MAAETVRSTAQEVVRYVRLEQLPLRAWGLKDIPAVPINLPQMLDTTRKLKARIEQRKQAQDGLNNVYTIGGHSATAYQFLYGNNRPAETDKAHDDMIGRLEDDAGQIRKSLFDLFREEDAGDEGGERTAAGSEPLTALALGEPEQWSMSWTRMPGVYQRALPKLQDWASTLTHAEAATAQFWPTIARYGLSYNLLFLKKVGRAETGRLKDRFRTVWTPELDTALSRGDLYLIDLSIFETVKVRRIDGFDRFTPATMTLLTRHPESKTLMPVAVRVCGEGGRDPQVYSRENATDAAWLYALLAAKTSVTVFGIWLGHVYPWHIVTAALQMTECHNLPDDHPIHQLLAPHSKYLIPVDDVFLVLWKETTPPTSITTGRQFLELCNTYAAGREFFDDDPKTRLEALGLREEDFTADSPWDRYLLVRYALRIWDATEEYVRAFVDESYDNDATVAADTALQAWMKDSTDPQGGNVRGLPQIDGKDALARVLTSLLYRVTVHGAARLNATPNPAYTFVPNFPPCLQNAVIPPPSSDFDTRKLMEYLPRTGSIGEVVDFYFIFAFTTPYEPFIPHDGIESNLFFPNGLSDPRNRALVRFREAIVEFAEMYDPHSPQRFQWPLNVET